MSDQRHWDALYKGSLYSDTLPVQFVAHDVAAAIAALRIPTKERTCLDIGVGNGRHTGVLLEQGFSRITGIDLSNVALEQLAGRLGVLPTVELIREVFLRYRKVHVLLPYL